MSGSNSSNPAARRGAFDQPLGLTVHSLPVPQEAAVADSQRTRMGRWKMLVVALVCAAPVVASYFMYYVVRPEDTPSGIAAQFGTSVRDLASANGIPDPDFISVGQKLYY